MTSITYKDRRDDHDHKTRMTIRRARQLARTPGFTPVTNQRIRGAVMGLTSTLIAVRKDAIAEAEKMAEFDLDRVIPTELSTEAATQQAWSIVAQRLPQAPIGVRVKPIIGTGKTYV